MTPSRHNQARLADAGRALQQQQRTTPGDRVTQPLIDPGESGVSLQKYLPTHPSRPPAPIVPPPKFLGPPPQKQVVSHGAASIRPRDAHRMDENGIPERGGMTALPSSLTGDLSPVIAMPIRRGRGRWRSN